MMVEFKKVTNEKDFRELEDGAFFGFGGDFYIKMAFDLYTEDEETFNAVEIESGYPASFGDNDEVIEYPKAKIVIE